MRGVSLNGGGGGSEPWPSSIFTHLSQDKLSITVSGAGEVSGDGHVGNLDLHISGAGQARLRDVSVDSVKADLSDAGHADLSPTDSADITLNGASEARLATSPKTLTSHVFGFGKITGKTTIRNTPTM